MAKAQAHHNQRAFPPIARRICFLGCVLQLASASPVWSQGPPTAASTNSSVGSHTATDVKHDTPGTSIKSGEPIKIDVDLVLVNVNVNDPFDRRVVGLDQDNFRVFEDGVEQEILACSSEDVPISIGVVMDFSETMTKKIDKARAAVTEFLKTANKHDEFFLVGFNTHAELMTAFTGESKSIQDRILLEPPGGATALLDAVYLGLTYMRNSRLRRRALLIFSDGGDNHSRHSEKELKRIVQEADVQLYALGFYNPIGYPYQTIEELHGPSLLEEITELTGGQVFPVENLGDLRSIAAKVSEELRNQYVLAYKPSNHLYDGHWRKIKVKIRPPRGLPPLQTHAKTGYYAKVQ